MAFDEQTWHFDILMHFVFIKFYQNHISWQDAVAELSRVAEESLLGIGTVRALGAEERLGWGGVEIKIRVL